MPVITDAFRFANRCEAGLWFVVAAVAIVIAIRKPGGVRRRCAVLAVAMIAFGVSDIVEATTGAWWRPWWLLVWKGVCVGVFVSLFADYLTGECRGHRERNDQMKKESEQ